MTCGDNTMILHENQSSYIPLGEKHRLENPGKTPLCLIEMQSAIIWARTTLFASKTSTAASDGRFLSSEPFAIPTSVFRSG